MSAVAEASTLLRRVAEPRPVGDTIKSAISRAARRVSGFMRNPMSFTRAEDIWRAEARAIRSEEMDAIRRAAEVAKRDKLNAARDEYRLIVERIERLEEALRVRDEDFHRPDLDALRTMVGGEHRTLDRGD